MSKKALFISLRSRSSLMTIDAMKRFFKVVDDFDLRKVKVIIKENIEVRHNGEPLEGYDCVFIKGSFRYLPLLYAMAVAFEDKSYLPIRSKAFYLAHDKILMHLFFAQNKIPMPKTYLATPVTAKRILEDEVHYPVIIKLPHGTQGRGVIFAESYAAASSMLDAIIALRQPFLIQEYVETGGKDLRVFVIGNRVAAAMQRIAKKGEARANIHAGAKGKKVSVGEETSEIAVKVANLIDADVCAVDILESGKGPLVIEANISPGLRGITAVTKKDIAKEIAHFVYRKTEKFIEMKKKIESEKLLREELPKAEFGKQIVTNLDFRGKRILLPEIATKASKFKEGEEVAIKIEEGRICVERF